jgi:hypothetical protein
VSRRPRLSERSQFIELVGKALSAAGLNPEDEKLMLHEVGTGKYLQYLQFTVLLLYQFIVSILNMVHCVGTF